MSNGEGEGRYWWWNLNELQDTGFFAMIVAVGADNLRMEFHPQDEGAELKLVDRETGELCGTYNVSHVCPPDCD